VKSGLREGDVIQEVNKQPVKSSKDLLAISKKLKPNEKILMRVYSQGRSGYVAVNRSSGMAVASAVLSLDLVRCEIPCAETAHATALQISKSTLAFQPLSVRSTEKS